MHPSGAIDCVSAESNQPSVGFKSGARLDSSVCQAVRVPSMPWRASRDRLTARVTSHLSSTQFVRHEILPGPQKSIVGTAAVVVFSCFAFHPSVRSPIRFEKSLRKTPSSKSLKKRSLFILSPVVVGAFGARIEPL